MTFPQRRPPRPSTLGAGHAGWSGLLTLWCSLASVVVPPLAAQARAPHVALVLDRDNPRFHPLIAAFQREVSSFFRPGEIELMQPVAGDGTAAGVATALNGAFRDPAVSIVVALGPIGSHVLASSGSPAKPSIAGWIIDAAWQGIPQEHGASGVRRLTYIDQSYPVGGTLADFFRLIPFHKLAVLLDRGLLQAIPGLAPGATEVVRSAGGEAAIVAAGGDPTRSSRRFPPAWMRSISPR